VPAVTEPTQFRRPTRPPTPDELRQILQVWRGIHLIVAARGFEDDLASDVERIGLALRAAADTGDRAATMAAVSEAQAWLQQLSGSVTAMMTAPFRRLT
jgi:hypothetical protein